MSNTRKIIILKEYKDEIEFEKFVDELPDDVDGMFIDKHLLYKLSKQERDNLVKINPIKKKEKLNEKKKNKVVRLFKPNKHENPEGL